MDALQGSWQQRMGLLDLSPVAAPQVRCHVPQPACSPCTWLCYCQTRLARLMPDSNTLLRLLLCLV